MDRKAAKHALLITLEEVLDPELLSAGFQRSSKSETYTRRVDGLDQRIVIVMDRPRFSDDPSDAHITSRVLLASDAILEAQLSITGDASLVQGGERAVFSENIGSLGPTKSMVEWKPIGRDEFYDSMRELTIHIKTWVIPFLDQCRSIRDLLKLYENGQFRLGCQRMWEVRIAAAYVAVGQPEKALEVLEQAVTGWLAYERQYANTLANLRTMCLQSNQRARI
jgi:hypothetical protein